MTPVTLTIPLISTNNNHNPQEVEIDVALAQLERKVIELAECQKYLARLQQQQEQAFQRYHVAQGIQALEGVAERINTLAAQLEAEILKFKEIAVEVNRSYCAIQQPPDFQGMAANESSRTRWKASNIWEVHDAVVPHVTRRGVEFILSAKTVDLLATAEKENAEKRAAIAQRRREAFERWLVEQRGKKGKR